MLLNVFFGLALSDKTPFLGLSHNSIFTLLQSGVQYSTSYLVNNSGGVTRNAKDCPIFRKLYLYFSSFLRPILLHSLSYSFWYTTKSYIPCLEVKINVLFAFFSKSKTSTMSNSLLSNSAPHHSQLVGKNISVSGDCDNSSNKVKSKKY